MSYIISYRIIYHISYHIKCENQLLAFSCLSVRPLPQKEFSSNFILQKITKTIDRIKFCSKSDKATDILF